MSAYSGLHDWLHEQAVASQAEHDLLIAVANCLAEGAPKPDATSIANVQRLHSKARAGWAEAMAQLVLEPLDRPVQQMEGSARLALQYVLGTQHVYQNAVLALIETHTEREMLREALGRHFATDDAGAQGLAPDSFAQGVADAQNLVRLATMVSSEPS